MENKKQILGWFGVLITIVISGFWAYWGSYENFHEGWYSTSIWTNLFMFLFQYMVISVIFVLLALTILKWKKFGFGIHIVLAFFSLWFFSGARVSVIGVLLVIPFILLGSIYYYGDPRPKKWAYRLIIFIPLIITLAISIPQYIKVSKRIDDGDLGLRIIESNGVTLSWAPRGPGWPDQGISWEDAQDICEYLSVDGTEIMDTKQYIWRLPTVDEAVRSMMIHGQNAGGVWDAADEKALYDRTPDKESPMWDVHSQVIYYWTAETSIFDDSKSYIIVYHGGVFTRKKSNRQGYLSFRAVKEVE
jgi:hypothetical protein